VRTAYNLLARYRKEGMDGLRDGRRGAAGRAVSVMTPEVKAVVLAEWFSHPAAGPKAIWQVAHKECARRNLPVPKYPSVWRYLDERPEAEKLLRAGNLEKISKEYTSVVRFQFSSRANERFQFDHKDLGVWAKVRRAGALVPARVWITACLDEYSRSPAGFVVSTVNPNAWQIALALRHAILPKPDPMWPNKGLPQVIQPDRGMDFMSNALATSCAALRIRIDPDPPRYPNMKGKIERWFETLDVGCLRLLPGHRDSGCVSEGAARKRLDGLLWLHEVQAEIARWIAEDYIVRRHRTIGCPPRDAWEESVGVPLMPPTEDALNLLLLHTDERTVSNVGIEFRGCSYWAPPLASVAKQRVRLRYDPDDEASVLVYDAGTDAFVCEALVMGRPASLYGVDDVHRAAEQAYQGSSSEPEAVWTRPRASGASVRRFVRDARSPRPSPPDPRARPEGRRPTGGTPYRRRRRSSSGAWKRWTPRSARREQTPPAAGAARDPGPPAA
jgi:putative transposase